MTLDDRWRALEEQGRARYLPGMLTRDGGRTLDTLTCDWGPPVWSDPATLGCLLGLVREAWGDPGACTFRDHGPGDDDTWVWVCHTWGDGLGLFAHHGPTEAEALLAALEAAPC
jgi:hypothetical protein